MISEYGSINKWPQCLDKSSQWCSEHVWISFLHETIKIWRNCTTCKHPMQLQWTGHLWKFQWCFVSFSKLEGFSLSIYYNGMEKKCSAHFRISPFVFYKIVRLHHTVLEQHQSLRKNDSESKVFLRKCLSFGFWFCKWSGILNVLSMAKVSKYSPVYMYMLCILRHFPCLHISCIFKGATHPNIKKFVACWVSNGEFLCDSGEY